MERGFPDVGLITQTEMVENARYIADAVDIPLICDADNGYGNAINVWRTVREYENAGAAAIHIEDQVFPKRCGFFAGKELISMEEHVQKIRCALEARRDKDLVIISRCDALAVNGWDDTIRRCYAYREAGADVVFVDGMRTREDLENCANRLKDVPKLYNAVDVNLPMSEIAEMGFVITIQPFPLLVSYQAIKAALTEFRQKGVVSPEWMQAKEYRDEVFLKVLRLSSFSQMAERYGTTKY